ncbi:hypothetical protein ES703_54619 [subsurface metagenome]
MGLGKEKQPCQGDNQAGQQEKIKQPDLSYKKHSHSHNENEKCGGKIILKVNQGHKKGGDNQGRKNRIERIIDAVMLLTENVGQIQDQGEFHQFGRLKRETEEEYPAPCTKYRRPQTGQEGQQGQYQGQEQYVRGRKLEEIEGCAGSDQGGNAAYDDK